jgi:hypothetical protein
MNEIHRLAYLKARRSIERNNEEFESILGHIALMSIDRHTRRISSQEYGERKERYKTLLTYAAMRCLAGDDTTTAFGNVLHELMDNLFDDKPVDSFANGFAALGAIDRRHVNDTVKKLAMFKSCLMRLQEIDDFDCESFYLWAEWLICSARALGAWLRIILLVKK